jgi:hypothetical protein
MIKRDINGVPYTYENKDELAFGTDFEDSWDNAMAYAHYVMTTPEFEKDMKEWLDKND